MSGWCPRCGMCCQLNAEGQCAGAYEGICHIDNPDPEDPISLQEQLDDALAALARAEQANGELREALSRIPAAPRCAYALCKEAAIHPSPRDSRSIGERPLIYCTDHEAFYRALAAATGQQPAAPTPPAQEAAGHE